MFLPASVSWQREDMMGGPVMSRTVGDTDNNAESRKRLCLNKKIGQTQAVCCQASVTLHLQCGWDPLIPMQPNSLYPFLSLPGFISVLECLYLFILRHLQRQLENM